MPNEGNSAPDRVSAEGKASKTAHWQLIVSCEIWARSGPVHFNKTNPIDENDGSPGVRLRERTQRRSGRWCRAVGYRSRVSAIEGAGIQFIDEMAEGSCDLRVCVCLSCYRACTHKREGHVLREKQTSEFHCVVSALSTRVPWPCGRI